MKRLPLSRHALQRDFPAEQACELATDRESQARASVFAAGSRVRLLKRLEDQLLLVGLNSDAGIVTRNDTTAVHRAENGMLLVPAVACDPTSTQRLQTP